MKKQINLNSVLNIFCEKNIDKKEKYNLLIIFINKILSINYVIIDQYLIFLLDIFLKSIKYLILINEIKNKDKHIMEIVFLKEFKKNIWEILKRLEIINLINEDSIFTIHNFDLRRNKLNNDNNNNIEDIINIWIKIIIYSE
jgi:hypothetical protein